MVKGYLLIDGSYFCFYRYYAIMRWWKCKTNGETLDFPIKNEEFVNKFRTTFIATIKSLYEPIFDYDWNECKNIKIIVGKDCRRKSIWRMDLFDKYKGNRLTDADFAGGPLFQMAYEELFKLGGVDEIVSYDTLEADDCIALLTHELLKDENNRVKIITSDTDYLQLFNDINCKLIDTENRIHNLKIYNLKKANAVVQVDKFIYKFCEKENINPTWQTLTDHALFYKVIHGDKSDNIPQIIKPLSKKKYADLYEKLQNKELKKYLKEINKYDDFKRNVKLINFNKIPNKLRIGFLDKYEYLCIGDNSGSYVHSN